MKTKKELFILEDHDCNYKIFSDIDLAYQYVKEEMLRWYDDEDAREILTEIDENRTEYSFYADDFCWCYSAEYYEREVQ